jgi:GTPase SAR1 family protein
MALFNYATKEITLKIVYYGPGLSGKTTNLQYLHTSLSPESTGKLLSLSTEADRTLFFDFMPVELGKIKDFSIRFQLYTVPGQVRYNATRRVVLKGADAVVFVADSQTEMREQNIESFENMMENLQANNVNPDDIPIILQYNKRDLKNILSIEELDRDLNTNNYRTFESSAISGAGVRESYERIIRLLLENISEKHKIEIQSVEEFDERESPEVADAELIDAELVTETVRSETAEEEMVPEYELKTPDLDVFEDKKWAEVIDQEQIVAEPVAETVRSETAEEEMVPEYELKTPDLNVFEDKKWAEVIDQEQIVAEPVAETVQPETAEEEMVPEYELKTPDLDVFEEENKVGYDFEPRAETAPEEEEAHKPAAAIKVVKEIKEIPVIPLDKIDSMVDELSRVNVALEGLQKSFVTLDKSLSLITGETKEMKDIIKSHGVREIKELREIKKEQSQANNILHSFAKILGNLKGKKSWFKL